MVIEETEGTIIDSETMKIVKIGKLAKLSGGNIWHVSQKYIKTVGIGRIYSRTSKSGSM